jgi:hypothetical protein
MNYARFAQPTEQPETPKRRGTFELEEAWLGIEHGGKFRFFGKPSLAAVQVQLKFDFTIGAGESEVWCRDTGMYVSAAEITRVYWATAGSENWDEIPCEGAATLLHSAATDFLESREMSPVFARWVEEHSEEVLPVTMNVFMAEIERAKAKEAA